MSTTKEESGLQTLVQCLQETLATRAAGVGHVELPFGFFANVIDIGGTGLAISTDGVGSKLPGKSSSATTSSATRSAARCPTRRRPS